MMVTKNSSWTVQTVHVHAIVRVDIVSFEPILFSISLPFFSH